MKYLSPLSLSLKYLIKTIANQLQEQARILIYSGARMLHHLKRAYLKLTMKINWLYLLHRLLHCISSKQFKTAHKQIKQTIICQRYNYDRQNVLLKYGFYKLNGFYELIS